MNMMKSKQGNRLNNYEGKKMIITCDICRDIIGFITAKRRIETKAFIRCRICERLE